MLLVHLDDGPSFTRDWHLTQVRRLLVGTPAGSGAGSGIADGGSGPLEQVPMHVLRRRTSMKWQAYPADVLPLWVAEMDVMLAPAIRAALAGALDAGDTGYPAGTAMAEAVQGFAERRWGWSGIEVRDTAVVPDVMLGAVELLRLVSEPGDAVVVNCPVYPPFYAFVEAMDRRIIEAPLTSAGRIDIGALETAFATDIDDGRVAALLLSSPHNPTGTVHTREELTAVASLAARWSVRVIVDEIHAPLVLAGATFTPFLSVPGGESAMSLISASKGWNLAGLKAALAIAGPDAAEDLARLPEVVGHGPSHLGLIAHAAAFAHADEWLDALLVDLARNRDALVGGVASLLPGVSALWPEATYLAWLDCAGLGLPAGSQGRGDVRSLDGPARFFLDEARVALSSGPAFGTGGADHVRLNFACSSSTLDEALNRMADAIARRQC